ncbi:hypothetical protein [Marilutibacter chinensis]|uniref:Uncharacterized protein n=1 Tax=Marilutibacter chinensis TaxID=2912247 RepID=A0ABS9HW04_9GAMM|nr:hypothetical protein [Lysobacter chinensis]MCF7222913.1 hypothetical protein [Lysobacter chinensis]
MFRMICATGLLAAFLFSLPAGFAGTSEPGKRANYYKLKVTLTEAGRSIDMPVLIVQEGKRATMSYRPQDEELTGAGYRLTAMAVEAPFRDRPGILIEAGLHRLSGGEWVLKDEPVLQMELGRPASMSLSHVPGEPPEIAFEFLAEAIDPDDLSAECAALRSTNASVQPEMALSPEAGDAPLSRFDGQCCSIGCPNGGGP